MRLPDGLLSAADFEAAIMAEVPARRSLMPINLLYTYMSFDSGESAEWAMRRVSGEFHPVPEQVVTVRKIRHGVRPVGELSIRDHLLYRALVARWSATIPAPNRNQEAFEAFRRGPLGAEGAEYVVSSDISAFYQYVDYSLLSRELLTRTGDAAAVDALVELLTAINERNFGLPQQSEPSDVLAEAYIDVIHRRLARQGLAVWRYNDDWRITTKSWSDALDAVDKLGREARRCGLTLNDSKTVIRKRETYKEDLDRADQVLKEIAEEAEFDLTEVNFTRYGDEVIDSPTPDDVNTEAARRVLRRWSEHRDEDKHPDNAVALHQLLPVALNILTGNPAEDEVLATCREFLRTEQSLTPQVANYYKAAIKDHDPAPVVQSFETLLGENPYLTPWQASWIGPSIRKAPGAFAAGTKQRAWLRSEWDDQRSPEPVRATIAATLARAGAVTRDELQVTYDDMTETGRPGIASALGAIIPTNDPVAVAVRAEDDLDRWAFDLGALDV